MNKKYYLILVVLAGAVFIARLNKPSEIKSPAPVVVKTSDSKTPAPVQKIPAPLPVTVSTQVEEKKTAPPTVTKKFAQYLDELGTCLQIKNGLNSNQEPLLDNLNVSVRSELGDLIEQSDDWSNTHVRLPNGEERRLRVEVEGTGEESSAKVLKYYGVDKENLPIRLPLPPEKTKNPSATFIASLENEGTVFLREKGVRGAYAQGAEIYYTERNGQLVDLELTYNKRTFRCSSLENEHSSCRCF